MPARGRSASRTSTAEETLAIATGAAMLELTAEQVTDLLGPTTLDVFMNDVAYWRHVPINVWRYTMGGYQVIKKWLSYREHEVLGRPLTPDEVREVTAMARRIAAILLMHPALDANYEAVKQAAFAWPGANLSS